MADITTTKIDAARRQTDAAIRLHFNAEDPFAIHTIAAAAHRILRDIAEKRGSSEWHVDLKKLIRPGMEKKFWSSLNKASNFLKHANEDPEGVLVIGEEINDFTIIGCCVYYQSLGYEPTTEMRGFMAWHMVTYPELLLEGTAAKALLSEADYSWWRKLSREESLASGKELIALAKRQSIRI